jgi:hypothetical protein
MTASAAEAELTGVWFVYDGDCPLCRQAATALCIRREIGHLELLDARTASGHILMDAINRKGFDLDDGMVIWHAGTFYHGADALAFMPAFGDNRGFFNRVNRLLFRSPRLATVLYPPLRAVRNLLLRLRGKEPIRNLARPGDPIFKPVFGPAWASLPPVFHRHYANRPFSGDIHVATGVMTVWAAAPLRLFAPLSRALEALPLVCQNAVPVRVTFRSEEAGPALVFDRVFRFEPHDKPGEGPGRRPYRFRSRMVPTGGNGITEVMRSGLAWRSAFGYDGEAVTLSHRGYAAALGRWLVPLPLTWLLGRVDAREWATGEDSFGMEVVINHWLFGRIYEYRGAFRMT